MFPAGRLSRKHRTLRRATAGIDSIPAGWPRRSCGSNSAVGALRSDRSPGPAPSTPFDPTGPAGPTAPSAPFGPTGPSGPAGPTAPSAPFGPTGPSGPAGPTAPSAPSGPRVLRANGALRSDRALRSCGANGAVGALRSDRALRSCGALQTQGDRVYFLLACSAIWAGTCLERVEIVLLAKDVRAGGRGDISCRHCQCCQTYDERNETFPHPTSH